MWRQPEHYTPTLLPTMTDSDKKWNTKEVSKESGPTTNKLISTRKLISDMIPDAPAIIGIYFNHTDPKNSLMDP